MAQTNFAALTDKQKLVWSRDLWQAARDQMFLKKFVGSSDGSMIQRITELTKTEKGEQCIFQLVADLVDDGVIGDNEREGNEEAMQSFEQIITIDLITHSVKNKGKMADQRTVIRFRETARDRLAYWLGNRLDQLGFLTLSGISYAYNCDGSPRTSSAFANLAFAKDVRAPSSKRALMFAGGELVPSSTASIAATDRLTYKAIVKAKAYANEHYIRPLMSGGKEYFICMLRPGSFAQLKQDPDYIRAVQQVATKSGTDSPFFTGGTVTLDGIIFHEHRLVYTTTGAGAGNKWGSDGNVNGTRTLLCGAQAMGMADLGPAEWTEKDFDYGSKQGINVDKMFGLLKPEFYSIYDKSVEDFGALTIDHAEGA
ncbi:N4-gp56 family major capsid protein [Solimonas marina]|uniref:N4-gp56 family major capsid protein n=1 Tax=Solimonas marina TaxID=2714601 RepID=A0A969W8P4_9GAMM|nr:N4-gp56 family major capsid protein [Solimonas marina]NKF21580.1 N4-gp56 family major capsid protein [Solimonas marina]